MGTYLKTIVVTTLLVACSCQFAQAEDAATRIETQPTSEASSTTLVEMQPKLDLDYTERQSKREGEDTRKLRLLGGIEEKNLAIEWDTWHNAFADAVMPRVFNNFAETYLVPRGATTYFRSRITADRHIESVEIIKSSGSLWFDQHVREAVFKLDGNGVLKFPDLSRRSKVSIDLAISTGDRKSHFLRFDDVEMAEVQPETPEKSATP